MNPRRLFSTVLLCLLVAMPLHADPQITNLDQLLENVREQQARQRALNRQREQAFLADRQRQQQLLDEARRDFEQRQQANQCQENPARDRLSRLNRRGILAHTARMLTLLQIILDRVPDY